MTRYTLRALAAQWRIWSATVAVLALAAVLVDVCLTHRFAVTRPEVVAAARAVGVGPAELEASGTSIYVYSAFTAIPVPTYTWPFIVTTWLMLAVVKWRERRLG